MDGLYIMESRECKDVVREIINFITANQYYKAILKLDFLKEHFTVEEVEGILDKTFFSELGDVISGMLCGLSCDECCESCSGGACCGESCGTCGTCIGCLIISYVTAKCIPGCGYVQEQCIHCACMPCHWCITECLPMICVGSINLCCGDNCYC